jgi:hypothetical protein
MIVACAFRWAVSYFTDAALAAFYFYAADSVLKRKGEPYHITLVYAQ